MSGLMVAPGRGQQMRAADQPGNGEALFQPARSARDGAGADGAGRMTRVIHLAPDSPDRETMTMNMGKAKAGGVLRLKDTHGRVWYGKVDDDGIALLTRVDLLDK